MVQYIKLDYQGAIKVISLPERKKPWIEWEKDQISETFLILGIFEARLTNRIFKHSYILLQCSVSAFLFLAILITSLVRQVSLFFFFISAPWYCLHKCTTHNVLNLVKTIYFLFYNFPSFHSCVCSLYRCNKELIRCWVMDK